MKRLITSAATVFAGIFMVFGCGDSDSSGNPAPNFEQLAPVAVQKTNQTKIYMHYMPWFETKASNGSWGYHWTMDNKNPDVIVDGKRQIASHYYPMIGPYHSGDKHVIENHLLMMKYAGVDGILIDWYGTYDLNDFRLIKQNTEQLIEMLDKVGMEYAIVYEDRFLTDIVNAQLAPSVTTAARNDLAYLQANFFGDANYIKINGKPLLLNFGPITIQTEAGWTSAFQNLNPKPTFLTLWHESADAGANASGEYAWVYQDNNHLADFYQNHIATLDVAFGSAYPGFNDFYEEGGTSTVIGWTIAHNNGATLDETLQMAASANVDYLQLITWNDFGEGTMIEPTVELGYDYVNRVRSFAGVQNAPSVFQEISRLHDLRVEFSSNQGIQRKIDQAFYYFVSLQTDKAIAKLNEIQ